jgi:hypothetical protein
VTFVKTFHGRVKEPFGMQLPSEKGIGCLRTAIVRLPNLHEVSIVLAKSLFHRFYLTYPDDDYNAGMAILDKAISFRGPGDTPSPYQEMALRTAIKFFLYSISRVWGARVFRASDRPPSYLA